MSKPTKLKAWKVRTTADGVVLTINGQVFGLGPSAHSMAHDLQRAAAGWNAPEVERSAEPVERYPVGDVRRKAHK